MKKQIANTLVSILRSLVNVIWKALCLIGKACCRIAGSFLAVAIAAYILYTQLPNIPELLGFDVTSSISDTVIYEELQAISELAVYEYRYTNHVDCVNKPQLLGHAVLATDHWFAFDYSGVIKVGCNFDEIAILWVDPASKTVVIHLPEVSVLSNEIAIDTDSYQDRNNLCNPLEPREVLDYLYACREPEEEKAIDLGILSLGTENAQAVVSLAVRSLGYEAVFK